MEYRTCRNLKTRSNSGNSEPAILKIALVLISALIISGCATRQARLDASMDHNHAASETTSSTDAANEEWAKQRLAKSSRHQEWVKIKYKPSGGSTEREVSAFLVYPEVKNKATAVVVIHEIFGMSDWVQSLTDQLAEALDRSMARRILTQGQMGPEFIVIVGVGLKDLAQMGLAEDDDVIEAFAADRADQSLRMPVLPR